MGKRDRISEAVIRRLPTYYHCLKGLENSGIGRVSSSVISGMLNVTASQVRQDFSNFGEFGQQGYGYDVTYLKNQISGILGLDKNYNVVLIGAGRIGRALLSYKGFTEEGFNFIGVFDAFEPEGAIAGVPLMNIGRFDNFAAKNKIDIAVIATPAESAKETAQKVKKAGINAIWNFAPIFLYMGEDVAIENISMSESLFMLAYKMNSRK